VLDASGNVVQTLDPASGATSLAFSPGGALATGTAAGTVELFDPASGRRLAPALIAGSPAVMSIAFNAGGGLFATTGDHDDAVKLWSTSSLQQEGPALSAVHGSDSTAAFAAGGRLLVVQDRGDAFSWPTALGTWERRACAVAGRNLTRPEWARLVARPNYARICP
jgi:WD40 repeat protein